MRGRTAALALGVAVAASLATATPARAGSESDFVSRINRERSARGLRTLVVRSDLVAAARRHSARMAQRGGIYHDPALSSSISGWKRYGSNVGRGPSVSWLHGSFMDSAEHRSNILGSFSEVGVGVVKARDQLWVTQIFVLRGTATAPRIAPRATRATAPQPPARSRPRARARRAPSARETPVTVDMLMRLMQRGDVVVWDDPPEPRRR